MSNLLFAVDNVLPVFLLVLTGWIAGRRGFITPAWSAVSGRLVFTLCLPALIFDSIYASDFRSVFSPGLFGFGLAATLLSLPPIWLLGRLAIGDRPARGAFIQGGFRGNFVILALPIIANIFGEEGRAKASILVTGVMPLYNVLAIVVLAAHSRVRGGAGIGSVARSIATNPLILAALAAIPFALTGIRLPAAAEKVLGYLGDIAMPVALIDLGAGMAGRRLGKRPLAIALATLCKIAILPASFTAAAVALGFRGQELGIIFMLGAAPTAVSSYIMAKAMDNDEALAGEIVLATTLGSVGSIFIGLWLLRAAGLL